MPRTDLAFWFIKLVSQFVTFFQEHFVGIYIATRAFPGGSDGKESTCNEGDLGLIPRSVRFPGGGTGYPLQDSCLENPMDRGAGCPTQSMELWRVWTRCSDWAHTQIATKRKLFCTCFWQKKKKKAVSMKANTAVFRKVAWFPYDRSKLSYCP